MRFVNLVLSLSEEVVKSEYFLFLVYCVDWSNSVYGVGEELEEDSWGEGWIEEEDSVLESVRKLLWNRGDVCKVFLFVFLFYDLRIKEVMNRV